MVVQRPAHSPTLPAQRRPGAGSHAAPRSRPPTWRAVQRPKPKLTALAGRIRARHPPARLPQQLWRGSALGSTAMGFAARLALEAYSVVKLPCAQPRPAGALRAFTRAARRRWQRVATWQARGTNGLLNLRSARVRGAARGWEPSARGVQVVAGWAWAGVARTQLWLIPRCPAVVQGPGGAGGRQTGLILHLLQDAVRSSGSASPLLLAPVGSLTARPRRQKRIGCAQIVGET